MDIIESEGRRGENMPLRPEVEHQKENGGGDTPQRPQVAQRKADGGENMPLRPQNAAPGKLAAPENSPGKQPRKNSPGTYQSRK